MSVVSRRKSSYCWNLQTIAFAEGRGVLSSIAPAIRRRANRQRVLRFEETLRMTPGEKRHSLLSIRRNNKPRRKSLSTPSPPRVNESAGQSHAHGVSLDSRRRELSCTAFRSSFDSRTSPLTTFAPNKLSQTSQMRARTEHAAVHPRAATR